ncbi:MAG: acyltransferase family protein, partial [Ilumatobacteraceae bacterium]
MTATTLPPPTLDVAEHHTHPVMRNQISRVPYLPGLDGLRALAVIGVMVYHANHEWLTGGFLGVEMFFVISGYLITLLLVAEKERTGRVSVRQFWMRRARRLLPALYTMMGALAIYMVFFEPRPMGATRGDFVAGLLYVSNWFQIFVGQSYTAAEAFSPLRHLWSLAVEEQFYLVWPLVMALVLRRRKERLPSVAPWFFAASVFITLTTAAMYVSGTIYLGADASGAPACGPGDSNGYLQLLGRCINVNEALYLNTFSRAGGLLLGAAFALVWRPVAIMRGPLKGRGRRVDAIALLALVGLALMMNRRFLFDTADSSYDPWLYRGGLFLVGLCTVATIAAATHRRSWIGRLLGVRPLHWVGTRSYGLYLFHWPIYQIIRE